MDDVSTLPIVRVGNSRGIRLPKQLIDQCRIHDRVEIQVRGRRIILIPIDSHPRSGWEQAAQAMTEDSKFNNEDDTLLIPDILDDDVLEPW